MAELRIGRLGVGATPGRVPADDSGVVEAQGDLNAFRRFKSTIDRVIQGHKARVEERQQREGTVEGIAAVSELRGAMELASDGLGDMGVQELDELTADGARPLMERFQKIADEIRNPHAKRIYEQGLAQAGPAFLAGFLDEAEDRRFSLKRAETARITPSGKVVLGPQWAGSIEDATFGDLKDDGALFEQHIKTSPHFREDEKPQILREFNRSYLTTALDRMAVELPDTFVGLIRSGAHNKQVSGDDFVRFTRMANDIQNRNFNRRWSTIERTSKMIEGEQATSEGLRQRARTLVEIGDSLVNDFEGDPAINPEDYKSALATVQSSIDRVRRNAELLGIGERAVAGGDSSGLHPSDPRVAEGVNLYVHDQVIPVLRDPETPTEEKIDLVERAIRAQGASHPAIEGFIRDASTSGNLAFQDEARRMRGHLQDVLPRVYSNGLSKGTEYGPAVRQFSRDVSSGRAAADTAQRTWQKDLDEQNSLVESGVAPATASQLAANPIEVPNQADFNKNAKKLFDDEMRASIFGPITDDAFLSFFASDDEGKPRGERGIEVIQRHPGIDDIPVTMSNEALRLFTQELAKSDGRQPKQAAARARNQLLKTWGVDHLDPTNPTFSKHPIMLQHGDNGVDYWQNQIENNAFIATGDPDKPFRKAKFKMGEDRFSALAQETSDGTMVWVVSAIGQNGAKSQVFFGDDEGNPQSQFFFDQSKLDSMRSEQKRVASVDNEFKALNKQVFGKGLAEEVGLVQRVDLDHLLTTDEKRARLRPLRRDPRRFRKEPMAGLIGMVQSAQHAGGEQKHADTYAAAKQIQERLISQVEVIDNIESVISASRESGSTAIADVIQRQLNEATKGIDIRDTLSLLNHTIDFYDGTESAGEERQKRAARPLWAAVRRLRKISLDVQQQKLHRLRRFMK